MREYVRVSVSFVVCALLIVRFMTTAAATDARRSETSFQVAGRSLTFTPNPKYHESEPRGDLFKSTPLRTRRQSGPAAPTTTARTPTAMTMTSKTRLTALTRSLGDALAVGCLALLFTNQLAVVLNLPFLLPFSLIPIAMLTAGVKLLSSQSM